MKKEIIILKKVKKLKWNINTPPHPLQNLQLYSRLGLIVTHVHSAIEFSQKKIFADYCSKYYILICFI